VKYDGEDLQDDGLEFILFLIAAISILRGAILEQMDFLRLKTIEYKQLGVAEGGSPKTYIFRGLYDLIR